VRPRFSRVRRFVNAVADGKVGTLQAFAKLPLRRPSPSVDRRKSAARSGRNRWS
jgi:hypothetical protein